MRSAISIIAIGLLWSWGAANAQCPPPSPSPLAEGQIGLFVDLAATQTCIDSPPLSLRLYVVARVPQGGVAEFEAPTLLQTSGASLVFSRSAYSNPEYQLLNVADDCPGGQRINPSSCPVAQGDLLTLAVIDVLAPSLGTYCFRSACEFIGGVVGRAPTYRRCNDGRLLDFTGGDLMCIGIGSAPVAVQQSMWGAVKVLYRDD